MLGGGEEGSSGVFPLGFDNDVGFGELFFDDGNVIFGGNNKYVLGFSDGQASLVGLLKKSLLVE